jgi:spermidine synthase
VQDYYLRAELSLFRLVYFRSILEKDKHYEINTDLRPRCYFYSLVLWGTTHFPTLREIVLKWRDLRLSHAVILICILGIFLFFLKTYFKPLPLLTAVGITGFTEISLEVVALISFQVFYGFVYSELALLITTFMLGLAIGSLIFYSHPPKSLIAWLRFLQVSLSLLSLFWLGVIYGLHEYKSLSQHPWFFHLIFPLFLGGAGTLGAMQFLTASQIYMGLGRGIKETAATLYSTDLLGSAMGAFLTSLIFLPLLGLPATLIFVVCLNLVALLILLFY